jgi:hypothetical protein
LAHFFSASRNSEILYISIIEHESKDFPRGNGVVAGGQRVRLSRASESKERKMDSLNESIDYLRSTNLIEPSKRKINKV